MSIGTIDQAINVTIHAPANAVYNTQFSVAATGGGSGNSVTFSSSGACTNAGATFTMTSGTGTCTVKYDQAGDSNYNPAPQVTETVNAQKAGQTITVSTHAPSNAAYNTSFGVQGNAPGGVVTFSSSGTCTNSGNTFTMTSGSGTCTVNYNQAGNTNYDPAPQVTESVSAQKANQTITFGALVGKTFGAADFGVSATASSGLAVSVAAAGKCTISGATVHITGVGSCTITASQAGNATVNAATDVARSFAIAKAGQKITFAALPNKRLRRSQLHRACDSVFRLGGFVRRERQLLGERCEGASEERRDVHVDRVAIRECELQPGETRRACVQSPGATLFGAERCRKEACRCEDVDQEQALPDRQGRLRLFDEGREGAGRLPEPAGGPGPGAGREDQHRRQPRSQALRGIYTGADSASQTSSPLGDPRPVELTDTVRADQRER